MAIDDGFPAASFRYTAAGRTSVRIVFPLSVGRPAGSPSTQLGDASRRQTLIAFCIFEHYALHQEECLFDWVGKTARGAECRQTRKWHVRITNRTSEGGIVDTFCGLRAAFLGQVIRGERRGTGRLADLEGGGGGPRLFLLCSRSFIVRMKVAITNVDDDGPIAFHNTVD